MFKNKVLFITGGTGSFGNVVLQRFLDSNFSEIRVFSRDEKKQEDMRIALNNDKVKFDIGDVRDYRVSTTRCAGWTTFSRRPRSNRGRLWICSRYRYGADFH